MNGSRNVIMFLVLVSALAAQMMSPISVRADGKVTPASTESPEITETPAPTEAEAPTDVLPTETPVASDSPTPDPVITETPVPTEDAEWLTEIPVTEVPMVDDERKQPPEISETESPTPEPATTIAPDKTDGPTLLESVAEIAAETSIVVLDENGWPLPLASQAAADAVAESDPMWCPAGQTPGSAGCSGSYATVTDLINAIGSVDNGTVYFTATPEYTTNNVSFVSPVNLTIQGGWNGQMGAAYAIIGNTTFTVPILVQNSSGNITINNVTGNLSINDATATGGARIVVENVGGNVTINQATVTNAAGVGIAVTGSADVNINNSTVTGTRADWYADFPWGDGVDIFTTGDVTITNSTISNNNYDGIYGYAHSYTFDGSTFVANGQNLFGGGINITTFSTVSFGDQATQLNNFVYDISIRCPNGYLGLNYDGPASVRGNIDTNCVVPDRFSKQTGQQITADNKTNSGNQVVVFVPASSSKVSFYLDCSKSQRSFTINLPNGDKVEIVCPVDGKAAITRMDNTTLPGPLPDGYTFASAFQVEILQVIQPPQREGNDFKRKSIPFIEEGGHIKVSFVAPSAAVGSNYSILYWDNGTWIPLKDFMLDTNRMPQRFSLDPGADPPDERLILSGVEFVNQGDASRVEVSTNFPGIFVLAQR